MTKKDVPGQTYLADPGGEPPMRTRPRLNLTPAELEVFASVKGFGVAIKEQVDNDLKGHSKPILERLWRDGVLQRCTRSDGSAAFRVNPEIDEMK